MFEGFPRSHISIIGPGGEQRPGTQAILTGELAMIDDTSVVIEPGDEMRRTLPNGREEVFSVIDATFYEPGGGIPAHYQVKYRRKGEFAPRTGGNYTVNVSGPNARVNINSQDNSTNTANVGNTFDEVRQALGAVGAEDRARIEKLIDEMETQKGEPGFVQAYQEFIAGVGEHVKIIAPFIPLLAAFIAPTP